MIQEYTSYNLDEGKKTEYVAIRLERGLFHVLKREADSKGIDLSSEIRQRLRQNIEV